MIWTILSIISFFIFLMLLLNVVKSDKSLSLKFHNNLKAPKYVENKVLYDKKLAGYKNKVFKNMNPNSNHILDTFMISKDGLHTYLVCQFAQALNTEQIIEVRVFDQGKTLIQTLYVSYQKEIDKSTFIKLPVKTTFVNIDVLESSEQMSQYDAFNKKRFKAYQKVIIKTTLAIFFLLIPLGYFLLSRLTQDELSIYMNGLTISLGLVLMISVLMMNYVLMYFWVKAKSHDGGKVYERIQSSF